MATLDIKKIMERYVQKVEYSESTNSYFIFIPYFFLGSDEGIAIKVSFDEQGLPIFSDCHTTLDYLEYEDVDIDEYRDRLERILKRYGMILDGNVFRLKVGTDDEFNVQVCLGFFIQALTLIANIALFPKTTNN